MKIALGSDHRGVEAARALMEYFRGNGHDPFILGDTSGKPSDYPDSAYLVGEAVASGQADLGMLICGSGIGMSMAANKVRGIRAAMCYDLTTARSSREHNDANVLTLGGKILEPSLAAEIVALWLTTDFAGGRHWPRVNKIMALERGKR